MGLQLLVSSFEEIKSHKLKYYPFIRKKSAKVVNVDLSNRWTSPRSLWSEIAWGCVMQFLSHTMTQSEIIPNLGQTELDCQVVTQHSLNEGIQKKEREMNWRLHVRPQMLK